MSARVAAGLLLLGLCQASLPFCAPQRKLQVQSHSGRYLVTLLPDTTVVVQQPALDSRIDWKLRFGKFCHHLELEVDDSEQRIVITDRDEGIWVYTMDGQPVSFHNGNEFTDNGRTRHHRFACHKNGFWLEHADIVGNEIAMTLADGSLAWLALGLDDEQDTSTMAGKPRRNQDPQPAAWVALFVLTGHLAMLRWMRHQIRRP